MDNIFVVLQYVAIVIMVVYFFVTGAKLLMGKDAAISGWTYMTDEDKAYYDEKKVKSTAGVCNLVAGVSLALMVVGQMSGSRPIILLTIVVFFVAVAAPNYLIKKTGYFIKK